MYYSPISTYEILRKSARGKLEVPSGLAAGLATLVELAVRNVHTTAAAELPEIHRDPFDRILIAQAKVERLTLVTRDATIRRYDVDTLEV